MVLVKNNPIMSSELLFVLSCVTEGEKDNTTVLLDQNLDWDLVLHLSLSHCLFPLVCNTLISFEKSKVPEYVIKSLRQHCLINALKVTSQNNEIIRIVKELNEHGINPIILKGSLLSAKINEDIIHRPSNDIDILVDPLEFDSTEKILEQMGYIRYSPDFQLTPRQQKTYLEIHHHFEYYHPQRATSVELHWKIRSFNVKKVPTAYHIGKQKINVSGYQIPVMDNENWLLFLMIHGYKHFWTRLRWLYDIKEFMNTPIDWNKVIGLADLYESKVILHQTLILSNYLFDVPIPNCLERSLNTDKKAMKIANIVIERLCIKNASKSKFCNFIKDFFVSYHYSNYTIKNKLNHLRLMTKPGLVEYKLISLPDILFPFYYIIRPIYWLTRRIPFLTVPDPKH